jgi:protein-S-isoprenylcysteine O-methyltransferase Ste14
MIGFLLQWPTIPTLIMFPVLVYVYARLARNEEQTIAKEFGREWDEYASRTPAFVPKIGWLGRARPTNDFGRQRNVTSTPQGD